MFVYIILLTLLAKYHPVKQTQIFYNSNLYGTCQIYSLVNIISGYDTSIVGEMYCFYTHVISVYE